MQDNSLVQLQLRGRKTFCFGRIDNYNCALGDGSNNTDVHDNKPHAQRRSMYRPFGPCAAAVGADSVTGDWLSNNHVAVSVNTGAGAGEKLPEFRKQRYKIQSAKLCAKVILVMPGTHIADSRLTRTDCI